MPSPSLHLVTFQEFASLGYKLAEKIKEATKNDPVDLIISINRGGAVISRILSDYLDVEIASFGMSSYAGINNQKELFISQELNKDLVGKNVLIVDEICDSGKTFIKAVEIAQLLGPKKIITATIFTKPHAIFTPDYHIEVSDKWVVFPYEVKETLVALKTFLHADTELQTSVKDYFLSLGITQEELAKVQAEVDA